MIAMGVWKTIIVGKIIVGCGALVWYQRECDTLDVMIADGYGK